MLRALQGISRLWLSFPTLLRPRALQSQSTELILACCAIRRRQGACEETYVGIAKLYRSLGYVARVAGYLIPSLRARVGSVAVVARSTLGTLAFII